ncbi:Stp1/IreP family PP2C-type Ser/Thr phosphatase [Thermococcus sp. AM4]|uniref:Stp1/IreP family PP2C-type Ser/Thr phosphatase n=1 Tax=Thermococcus sp. (strain AM4) TaxID=246969 RepID=UPI0001870A35|nr:Stp1/IreP family PP2C-type Ser/Thr phosphatase [Thermococcus sp. AM4]EEB74762.1 Protein serine/threonine phosphatase PrpC [Thermococcus sp. AM4]
MRILKKDAENLKQNWTWFFIFLVISSLVPSTPAVAAPASSGDLALKVNQSISEANLSLILLENYSPTLEFNITEIEKLRNETLRARILLTQGNVTLANETISSVWNSITSIINSKVRALNESLSTLKEKALNYSMECSSVMKEIQNETEKLADLPKTFYNVTEVNETLKQLASLNSKIQDIRNELNSCIQRVDKIRRIKTKETFIDMVLKASSGLLSKNESEKFINQLKEIDGLIKSGDITRAFNDVIAEQKQLLSLINEKIENLNGKIKSSCPYIKPLLTIDIREVMNSNNRSLVISRIREINRTKDELEQCISLQENIKLANRTLSILEKYQNNLKLNMTILEGYFNEALNGIKGGNLTLSQLMLERFWNTTADSLNKLAAETENRTIREELKQLTWRIMEKNYPSVTEKLDDVLSMTFSGSPTPFPGGTTTTTTTTTSINTTTTTTPITTKPSMNATTTNSTAGNMTGSTTSAKHSGGINWTSILKIVILVLLGILVLLAAAWFGPEVYYNYKQQRQQKARIKAAEEAVKIMGEILRDLQKKAKQLGITDSPTVYGLLNEMQQLYSRAVSSFRRGDYVTPTRIRDTFSVKAAKLNSIIAAYETTFSLTDEEFKKHVAAKSYIGRRDNNEDYYIAKKIGGNILLAVADGMGGHLAGEVASRKAIEILEKTLERNKAENPEKILKEAIKKANDEIYIMGHDPDHPERYNMGTTLTAAIIRGNNATIGNIGDSRTYLIKKDGTIKRLTKDHSFVQELVDRGEITEAEARVHPQKNVLTKAIGISPEIRIDPGDINTIQLKEGDYLLLCSDGLSDVLTDEEIAKTVVTSPSLEEAVQTLIEKAYSFGSTDNITVVLYKHPRLKR